MKEKTNIYQRALTKKKGVFENTNKIGKPLARLIKKRGKTS